MTDAAASLLCVRDLKVDFRAEEGAVVHAVRGVSFDIPMRGTVAIVGESGSGKSVTALAMMGLLPRSNATVLPGSRVELGGENLLELPPARMRAVRGGEISMVFQEPMSSLNPVFTAGFQLVEVLRKHAGLSARLARARAVELLREVGIPEPEARLNAYPHELSGGQQQRVMIAMAIACEPKLLIADEPTTALDVTVERQILKLIADIQARRQMAMLFITHDLALVAEIADHVVVMRDGEVREQGSVRSIFEDPRDDYTRALLACRPPLMSRPRRLPVVDDFRDGAHPPPQPERARGLTGDEETVIEVRRLVRHFHFRQGLFGRRTFAAVKDVSFKLARGRTLGVVGESGSGKTTMALAVMRLGPAAGGEVLFDGRDLLALPPPAAFPYKRRIQIVFQNPYASLNPRFTAGEILMEPMRIHAVGAGDAERAAMARELLGRVGLTASDFLKYPHEFSGGQRQRIAIARCLTMKPDVLICDEAVSALDVSVQAQLLNLLQDLQDEYRMSYIFISHDLAVVRYMADQVMVMRAGEVVELAGSDELYARPAHPYTRELISAMPAGWRGAAARPG
jgi:peptide/nickel transport system ATP-binding protein